MRRATKVPQVTDWVNPKLVKSAILQQSATHLILPVESTSIAPAKPWLLHEEYTNERTDSRNYVMQSTEFEFFKAVLPMLKEGVCALIENQFGRVKLIKGAINGVIDELCSNKSDLEVTSVRKFLEKWTNSSYFSEEWRVSTVRGCFNQNSVLESCKACHGFRHSVGGLRVEEELLPCFIKHLTVYRESTDKLFRGYRNYHLEESIRLNQQEKPISAIGSFLRPSVCIEKAREQRWDTNYQTLNSIENLSSKGQIRLAYEKLEELEGSLSFANFGEASTELKVLHYRLKGLLLLRLERFEESIKALCTLEVVFSDAECIAFKAQALANLKNHDEAKTAALKAYSLNRSNATVVATLLLVHLITNSESEVESIIDWNSEVLHSLPVSLAVGHALANRKEYENATLWFEKALSICNEEPSALFGLACSRLLIVQGESIHTFDSNCESFREEIENCKTLLEKARELCRAYDFQEFDERCIQILAGASVMLEDWEGCINYIESSCSEVTLRSCAIHKFTALRNLGRLEEAYMLAESLSQADQALHHRLKYWLAEGKSCLVQRKTSLEELLAIPTDFSLGRIYDLADYAVTLQKLGASERAAKTIDRLYFEFKESTTALLLGLRFDVVYRAANDSDEVLLSKGVSADDLKYLRVAIANLYAEEQLWLSSCDQLLKISDIRNNAVFLYNLIHCQNHAGLSHAAAYNCRRLRELHPDLDPRIIKNLELDFFADSGDWKSCVEVCDFLIEHYPKQPVFKVYKALVLIKGFRDYQNSMLILSRMPERSIPSWAKEDLQPILTQLSPTQFCE